MRKTFREFVEARDEDAKPLFGQPSMPGSLRTAGSRFSKTWDSLKSRDPDQFHDRFTQPRRVRAAVGNNAQQIAGLAKDTSDLNRIRTNSMFALNKAFSAQRQRLRDQD